MEKVATPAGCATGAHREVRSVIGAMLALCAACPAVSAQESTQAPTEVLLAGNPGDPAVRVQLQTTALPRLEAQDSGFQSPRIEVSLFPTAGASGFGALLGMTGFTRQGPQLFGLQMQRPSFDVGLRWSQRVQSQQVDIMAWRRMSADEDAYSLVQARQPLYGARVEMNLSSGRKSGLAADLGFVGLQMEGGARISIKRKNGGPMVYYRSSF